MPGCDRYLIKKFIYNAFHCDYFIIPKFSILAQRRKGKKRPLEDEEEDEVFSATPQDQIIKIIRDSGVWFVSHYGQCVKKSAFPVWAQSDDAMSSVKNFCALKYTREIFIDVTKIKIVK